VRRMLSAQQKNPTKTRKQVFEELNLADKAAALEVKLTNSEITLLAKRAGAHQELHVTRQKFIAYSRNQLDKEMEREAFLTAIEEPAAENSTLGKWILPVIGFIGTASYAIAGTQVAGDAGMNVIGCTFVGCLSSLGGGTLNSILFGYAKNGVPFAKDPRNLMVALVSSVTTFVCWPIICRALAEERLKTIQETAQAKSWWRPAAEHVGLVRKDGISKSDFLLACEEDAFYNKVRKALKGVARSKGLRTAKPTPEQLFSLIDVDNNGYLDLDEIQKLVLLEHNGSVTRYTIDTVALSTSSVHGAACAISRGLHPVVCCVSGVTACFGGILRDLICNRDVALGTQSFAASTAAGATVYVGLREAALRGYALPLNLRVLCGAATTVLVRVLDYSQEGALLPPMHGRGEAGDNTPGGLEPTLEKLMLKNRFSGSDPVYEQP